MNDIIDDPEDNMNDKGCPRYTKFRRELSSLLNMNNKENGSNTPDYILSGYLRDCLNVFDDAVNARTKHYGYTSEAGVKETK